MLLSGETEASSAGTQLAEGYLDGLIGTMIIVDGVLIQSSLRSSNNIGMIDPFALKNPRPQGGISPLSVSSLIFTLSQYISCNVFVK